LYGENQKFANLPQKMKIKIFLPFSYMWGEKKKSEKKNKKDMDQTYFE
jgi:hypothetical protein